MQHHIDDCLSARVNGEAAQSCILWPWWDCLLGQHLCVSFAVVKLQIVAKRVNPILSFPLQLVPFAPISSLLFALFNGFWGFRVSQLSEFL